MDHVKRLPRRWLPLESFTHSRPPNHHRISLFLFFNVVEYITDTVGFKRFIQDSPIPLLGFLVDFLVSSTVDSCRLVEVTNLGLTQIFRRNQGLIKPHLLSFFFDEAKEKNISCQNNVNSVFVCTLWEQLQGYRGPNAPFYLIIKHPCRLKIICGCFIFVIVVKPTHYFCGKSFVMLYPCLEKKKMGEGS